MIKRVLYGFIFFVFFALMQQKALAQNHALNDTIRVRGWVQGNDTIPWIILPEYVVTDKMPRRLRMAMERWTRLRYAVYKTYPYAIAASHILKDVDVQLAAMPNKKQRKIFIEKKEKELKDQFGGRLEDLSVYQGKILMKLISRQTGENCYAIIKELKGGFSARMWQTVAFFFGSNLKSDYDLQEDRDIEVIVKEIQTYQGKYN